MPLPVCSTRKLLYEILRLAAVGAVAAHLFAGAEHRCAAAELDSVPAITNVSQLRNLAEQNPEHCYRMRLEGTIWWADARRNQLVLQDSSGAAELELVLPSRLLRPGERIAVSGIATLARRGAGFRLGNTGPVVDNNGVHSMVEKSGAVYLAAGSHPLRVEWFNGVEGALLEVEFEGPGIPRQRIPDNALFRLNSDGTRTGTNPAPGLNYRLYQVAGELLPDFSQITPFAVGSVTNFDVTVAGGREHTGLQFAGSVRVPSNGVYRFYTRSDDGSRLFIDESSLDLQVGEPAELPAPRRVNPGQTLTAGEEVQWAKVEGTVIFASEGEGGLNLELQSGTGRLRVEVADGSGLSPGELLNSRLRAVGVCVGTYTMDGQQVAGVLLVSDASAIHCLTASAEEQVQAMRGAGTGELPLLTSLVEVHRLKREQAGLGYRVRVRGVVTCVLPEHQAFTFQDATRGLYVVDASSSRSAPPELGEFVEVEGVTDPSLFAPIVNARRVTSLGAGHLPEPVRPTWDQLMSGSLDAQYVELEGIVTGVQNNGFTLHTRGGIIQVELREAGATATQSGRYENALVRVRGTLFATWDYLTHQVKPGQVRVYDARVTVDESAPADLFSVPAKTVAELRLFDPQAGIFQRTKVLGQVVQVREDEVFMMQGVDGVRFVAAKPVALAAGDEAEVVGFPELFGSASPVLRQAVARKTGHRELPEPRRLASDNLLRPELDSTRVRLDAVLVSQRNSGSETVFELQSGIRNFIAHLAGDGAAVPSLRTGSRVEMTGVYAAAVGNAGANPGLVSFELLLNSANDVKVLAQPPWWTLERLLVITGALLFVLLLTVLWITQLHRQVEERTAELSEQIHERQRVEHQREMEQERARIAQDLHDELGSGITEIGMLAARAGSSSAIPDKRSRHLEQMSDKAREMVTALDEIVWAMNPRHDSFASLVSYFSLYADRFLGLAGIAWRLDAPAAPSDRSLNSRRRHQLFLAFKEALTNIVRHSGATEVRVVIRVEQEKLRLAIADNGRGLPATASEDGMDGVLNMRLRIEKLGGEFEIESEPGRGTQVRFCVPAE